MLVYYHDNFIWHNINKNMQYIFLIFMQCIAESLDNLKSACLSAQVLFGRTKPFAFI